MNKSNDSEVGNHTTQPWNKGKLVGSKPPLRPKHVWAIRARLQLTGRPRDLALFNLAIDSKLRGRDVVRLKKVDVAPQGCAADRVSVRQRKKRQSVRFEMTELTRQAIGNYLLRLCCDSNPYLFPGRRLGEHLSTRQYARLLLRLASHDRP
jgi:integrase